MIDIRDRNMAVNEVMKGVRFMVIRKAADVVDLLGERVEAMEDLNCEDLEVCVRSFMLLHMICLDMEHAKELAQYEPEKSQLWVKARETFERGRAFAEGALKMIDKLTLRDNAVD